VERSLSLLFNRYSSCRSTTAQVARVPPRRGILPPSANRPVAVFFTSCNPSCPRDILQTATQPPSVAVLIMDRTQPKVESLFIPCRMSTMGPSMPSGFVTSMEVEASSPSDGRVQRDHPIQNDPSAPILVTSRTPLVVALPLLLTSGDA